MLDTFQILGYSGGIPTQSRGTTCLMVSTSKFDLMLDCGEGSYLRWNKAGYKWKNLQYIIITHMHPDHTGGLVPLLFYRKIYGIKSPLTIIGPPNLKDYLSDSFRHTGFEYIEKFYSINIAGNSSIDLGDEINLTGMEMKHVIPCWGYALNDNNKKIVFITDTLFNNNSIELATKADVLIHESTYKNRDIDEAQKHFHTTEIQAMEIADKAQVDRLILTHFSQRLSDEDVQEWRWKGQACVVFDERQKI